MQKVYTIQCDTSSWEGKTKLCSTHMYLKKKKKKKKKKKPRIAKTVQLLVLQLQSNMQNADMSDCSHLCISICRMQTCQIVVISAFQVIGISLTVLKHV